MKIVRKSVTAVYDGEVFRPEESVDLPPNIRVNIIIDLEKKLTPKGGGLLKTAIDLKLDGPGDWAKNIDSYLYGEKKNEE